MELKHRFYDTAVKDVNLLIVPYGIETFVAGQNAVGIGLLLIVPYGIETAESYLLSCWGLTFNRTLWN